jgi:hypothetical protein
MSIDTMRNRIAGQALIEEVLHLQEQLPPRTALARAFGRSPLAAAAAPWYAGAQGEIAVGTALAQLPPEWTVFHSLPVGHRNADIDHLVVGRAGVFTINTKHHSGKEVWVAGQTFLVSGQRQPCIRNAEREAMVVSKLITWAGVYCTVEPVLAVVDAGTLKIRERPARVHVIEGRKVLRWLRKRKPVLTEEQVARIVQLVEQPGTWRPAEPLPEASRVRFAELRREVRWAQRVRMAWTLLPVAAIGALLLPNAVTALGRIFLGA